MNDPQEKNQNTPATASSDGTSRSASKTRKPRGGGLLRLLVLLLIVAGLGAGGWFGGQWLWAEYTDRMEAQQQQLQKLQQELRQLRETRVDVAAFTESRDALVQSQAALRDQIDSLAASVEDLRDAAQGGRRDLIQAEIEYLLRIAEDELYLTGDVDTTIYALQSADDRLRALEAPRLNPVREQIAAHISELGTVTVPDTTGMALKLGNLMRGVKQLPLAQSAHARQQQAETAQTDADAGWWQRFKAGTQRLFARLVTVDDAEPPAPLLQPEEHFFLYRNVELQFAAARAALLQGDAAAYRQSLTTAREWLLEYFDTEHAQVAGMLDDINGLLSVSLQPDLPDISGALQTFRELTEGVRR